MKYKITCPGSKRTVGCGEVFEIEIELEPQKKLTYASVTIPEHTCTEWLQGSPYKFRQEAHIVRTYVTADMAVT